MKSADVVAKEMMSRLLMVCMVCSLLLPVAHANQTSATMLRGEVILIIAQHHGQYEGTRGNIKGEKIPGDYVEAVNWAYNRQILAGMPTGIAADVPITRQDYMCLLSNYLDYLGVELEKEHDWLLDTPFKDVSSIARYALSSVIKAYEAGILSEKTKTVFVPDEYITKTEANDVWQKFLGRLPVYVAPSVWQLFWGEGYVPKASVLIAINIVMLAIIVLSFFIDISIVPAASLYTCSVMSLTLLCIGFIVGGVGGFFGGGTEPLLQSVLSSCLLACLVVVVVWAFFIVPQFRALLENFHDKMLYRRDTGATKLCYILYAACAVEVACLGCLAYVVLM